MADIYAPTLDEGTRDGKSAGGQVVLQSAVMNTEGFMLNWMDEETDVYNSQMFTPLDDSRQLNINRES